MGLRRISSSESQVSPTFNEAGRIIGGGSSFASFPSLPLSASRSKAPSLTLTNSVPVSVSPENVSNFTNSFFSKSWVPARIVTIDSTGRSAAGPPNSSFESYCQEVPGAVGRSGSARRTMAARRDAAIREKILVGINGRAANQQSRIRIKSKRIKRTGRELRRRREGGESIRKHNHRGPTAQKEPRAFWSRRSPSHHGIRKSWNK